MRHQKRKPKLGRTTSHREAMLENMVGSLITHQKIVTTRHKARAASRLADSMITLGKQGDLASRRRAYSILKDRTLVKTLFHEVAPLFKERNGGYTRVLHLGPRRGDGADMAVLEWVEKRVIETKTSKKPKKEKKVSEQPKTPAQETAKPEAEKSVPKVQPVQKPPRSVTKQKKPGKIGFMNKLGKLFRRRGGP